MATENATPKSLTLPALEMRPIKKSIGHIRHVLKLGGEYNIDRIEEVEVAGLGKFPVYSLDDGEEIVILDKKKKMPPTVGVDGVLYRTPTNDLSWIWHKLLQKFDRSSSSKGVSSIDSEIRESWKGNFQFRSEARDKAHNV